MCGVKKYNLLVDLDEQSATLKEVAIVSTKYAIALKGETLLLDIMIKDRNIETGQALWETIGRIDGIIDIDYDGHFGNYIYIEIAVEHDTKDTWKLICSLIDKYITEK